MSLSNPINPAGVLGSFAAMLPSMANVGAMTHGHGNTVTEQIREHARQAGHNEGYAEGFAKGHEEATREVQYSYSQDVHRLFSELDGSAAELKTAFEQWQLGLEIPLASLAIVIATKILGRELALDPDAIMDIARQAVGEVTHASEARIRVNPFDAPTVRARKSDVLAASVSLRTIEVVDDPHIVAGCVIESEGGTVDAQIDAMLAKALVTLRGEA